jgi:hypothetical protein
VNVLQNIVLPHARIFALLIAFGDLAIGLHNAARKDVEAPSAIGHERHGVKNLFLSKIAVSSAEPATTWRPADVTATALTTLACP